MVTLPSRRTAFGLVLASLLVACGNQESPQGGQGQSASGQGGSQVAQSPQPDAEDASAWRSWLSAAVQAPWEGDFLSTWDQDSAQEGHFTRLAPDLFHVQTRTALRQHSPEGQAADQAVNVEVACDGEELRILLPAVLGAGPTMATLPANRLGALEEVDPLGRAGLFRLDSMSPWHLLQRTLDYGRPQSSGVQDEVQQLRLEVPAGVLARFAKEEVVQAVIFLDAENAMPTSFRLTAGERTMHVSFLKLQRIQDVEAARASTKLVGPKNATALPLSDLVDAEIEAASAMNLDELGY